MSYKQTGAQDFWAFWTRGRRRWRWLARAGGGSGVRTRQARLAGGACVRHDESRPRSAQTGRLGLDLGRMASTPPRPAVSFPVFLAGLHRFRTSLRRGGGTLRTDAGPAAYWAVGCEASPRSALRPPQPQALPVLRVRWPFRAGPTPFLGEPAVYPAVALSATPSATRPLPSGQWAPIRLAERRWAQRLGYFTRGTERRLRWPRARR